MRYNVAFLIWGSHNLFQRESERLLHPPFSNPSSFRYLAPQDAIFGGSVSWTPSPTATMNYRLTVLCTEVPTTNKNTQSKYALSAFVLPQFDIKHLFYLTTWVIIKHLHFMYPVTVASGQAQLTFAVIKHFQFHFSWCRWAKWEEVHPKHCGFKRSQH